MRRINYKSDIPPLLLSLKVDEKQITVPDCDFIVRFYIDGYDGRHYDCSHIGGAWSNCEPSEDGTKLVCYINNQRLGIGELCAEFHYISPDRRYSDGSQKSVVIIGSTELGVELVEDNGDAVTEAAIDVTLPFIYRTAYEIARDHGYTGTAEDFYGALASVVGIADAEKKRVTAEITRNANEQERIENEESRLNAESDRVNAEAQRVRNEAIRSDAEGDRVEQEEDRKAKFQEITEFIATVRANEGNRESNERERQANEDTRITEEAKRVAAEKKRAAEFEKQKLDLTGKIDRSGDEMGGDLIFTDNAGVSFSTSDGGAHTMFNDTDDVAKFTADNGDTFEFTQNETPNKNSSAIVVSANLYNALDMTLESMGSALDGDAAYRAEAGDTIFNPDTCKIQRYNSTVGGFEDLCDPIDGKLYANKLTGYIYRWEPKTKKMVFVGGVKAYSKDEADSRFAKLDDATQIVKVKELDAGNFVSAKSMWIGDEGLLLGGDGNGHLTVEQDEVITDFTLNKKLATKVDKTDITQSTGTSTTAVMSQKAVSDAIAVEETRAKEAEENLIGKVTDLDEQINGLSDISYKSVREGTRMAEFFPANGHVIIKIELAEGSTQTLWNLYYAVTNSTVGDIIKNNIALGDEIECTIPSGYYGVRILTHSNEATGMGQDKYKVSILRSGLLQENSYRYAGVINKDSAAPTSVVDKVFCITHGYGEYANFDSIVVAKGEIAILKRDKGKWSKEKTNIASLDQLLTDATLRFKKERGYWINKNTGAKTPTSSAISVYSIPLDGSFSFVRASLAFIDTASAAIAFYSTDIISESGYMQGVSVSPVTSTYMNRIWESYIPDGAKLMVLTNRNDYLLEPTILCDLHPNVFVNDIKGEVAEITNKVSSISRRSILGNWLFRNGGVFYHHLFMDQVTDKTKALNSIIPSQSIFDVRLASRLGMKVIEANVHKTLDGGYIVTHGLQGNFGYDFEDLSGNDVNDVSISSKSLSWIEQNIRYRCSIGKYRVAPTTLEDFLYECRKCNIIPFLQYVDMIEKTIADNILGIDNYILYAAPSSVETSAPVYQYISSHTSKEQILSFCHNYKKPFIYGMGNVSSFSESQLQDIVNSLHAEGYFISAAANYISEEMTQKVISLGFDCIASNGQLNDNNEGNLCNLDSGIDFNDYSHEGSIDANYNLSLPSGKGVGLKSTMPTIFVGSQYLDVTFTGGLDVVLGELSLRIYSDGKKQLHFSRAILNNSPYFYVSAVGATTIQEIRYRASKL